MSRRDALRIGDCLDHVVRAIGNIGLYTAGMSLETYLADGKTQDAVLRNLEVIGEACHRITTDHPAFAAAHPQVPWLAAYGMRNALAHGYFKVDQQIVWSTIRNDLPTLESEIQSVQRSLPGPGAP